MRGLRLMMMGILAAGCATKGDMNVESLLETISQLEARVSELEQFSKRVEAVVDLPADPEREQAALEIAYKARDAMEAGDNEGAKALLKSIVAEYPDTQVAPAALALVKELDVIGSALTELTGVTWFKGEHTLNADRVTVLVFFEAWCPHCQREMPEIQKRYEAGREAGLDVVGLTNFSNGTSESDMETFLSEAGVNFPIGRHDGSLSDALAANGVPHAAVVVKEKVVWIGHPAELSAASLDSWLGKENP